MSNLKNLASKYNSPNRQRSPAISPMNLGPRLQSASSISKKTAILKAKIKSILDNPMGDDCKWRPEGSKISSLETIRLLDLSKPVLRKDLLAIVATHKTLGKFQELFSDSWLEEYDALRATQVNNLGDSFMGSKVVSAKTKGMSVMSKHVPNPFHELYITIESAYLLLSESGLFPQFDFKKGVGNLLKNDLYLEDDDTTSSVKGGHSKAKVNIPIHANDIPTMSSWSPKKFAAFIYLLKNAHAKNYPCDINTCITNDTCKNELYWQLFSWELIKDISIEDFFLSFQPDDLSSFIALGESLIKLLALPVGGDVSDANIIRKELNMPIDLSKRNNSNTVLQKIAKFTSEYSDIYTVSSVSDQKAYVNALFDVNLRGNNVNPHSKVLFQHLKDSTDPPVTTLKIASEQLLKKHKSLTNYINEAYALGMRFPVNFDVNKQGGGGVGGKRVLDITADNKKIEKDPKIPKQICQNCGIQGHTRESCGIEECPYTNKDDCAYAKSSAWEKCKAKFSKALPILGYPRCPNPTFLRKLKDSLSLVKTDANPNVNKQQGNNCCSNLNYSSHSNQCYNCNVVVKNNNDECMALMSTNISQFLNYMEIIANP